MPLTSLKARKKVEKDTYIVPFQTLITKLVLIQQRKKCSNKTATSRLTLVYPIYLNIYSSETRFKIWRVFYLWKNNMWSMISFFLYNICLISFENLLCKTFIGTQLLNSILIKHCL